jgi:hypothetical protein
MDKFSTVELINALFAKIDPCLSHTIAIPDDEFVDKISSKEGIIGIEDLVTNIRNAAEFLSSTEEGKTEAIASVDDIMMFLSPG